MGFVPPGPRWAYSSIQDRPAEAYLLDGESMQVNAPEMYHGVFAEPLPGEVLAGPAWSPAAARLRQPVDRGRSANRRSICSWSWSIWGACPAGWRVSRGTPRAGRRARPGAGEKRSNDGRTNMSREEGAGMDGTGAGPGLESKAEATDRRRGAAGRGGAFPGLGPEARAVAVELDDDGRGALPLAPEGNGYFSGTAPAAGAGTRYRFRLGDGKKQERGRARLRARPGLAVPARGSARAVAGGRPLGLPLGRPRLARAGVGRRAGDLRAARRHVHARGDLGGRRGAACRTWPTSGSRRSS